MRGDKMLTNAMKEEKNSSVGLQIWISGMTESFLLLIFRKKYVEVRKNSSVLSERAKGGMHMCNKKELSFSIFMIYSLADKWKMSPAKVYKILNSTGILDDYIIKCYDVLHTQGKDYLVEDITDFVKEKGVNV